MIVVVEQQNINTRQGCRIHIAHSLKTSESHFFYERQQGERIFQGTTEIVLNLSLFI